jgi:heme-degrading monooxygenase HmoA
MILQIVRFKSGLSEKQALEMSEERAPNYRALQGLVQKYYVRFPETGEYAGVYLWESEKALKEFRESPLFRTISKVYQVQGEADVKTGEVVLTLRADTRKAHAG